MITIQLVKFAEHADTIRNIRNRVFTQEQGVDTAIDFDGLDGTAIQALAFYDEAAVGTGRMLPDGHIGRIAVLPEFRNLGTGTHIMQALINKARQDSLARVFLGAQMTAAPFYNKLGFKRCGDEYIEANIQHIPMALDFDICNHTNGQH